jgi:hypothetical protein
MNACELAFLFASLFPARFPTTEEEYGAFARSLIELLVTSLTRSPAKSPAWTNAVEIAISRLIFFILIGFALIGGYSYGVAASMVYRYGS